MTLCLFNFRFSTAITPEQIQAKTADIFRKYNLTFDLDWHLSALPFLPKQDKLIKAVQTAIFNITKQHPKQSTGGGTSDGRFIAAYGAELIELGPSHATAHQVNECVNVDDLHILVKIYTQILEILFRN